MDHKYCRTTGHTETCCKMKIKQMGRKQQTGETEVKIQAKETGKKVSEV